MALFILNVSSSGYYDWLRRGQNKRLKKDEKLLEEIKQIHEVNKGRYGSPRIFHSLKNKGIAVGKQKVERLMQEHGIKSIVKRKFKVTTDSSHSMKIKPNLVCQDFEVQAPNVLWSGDITYIQTKEGWLYLSMILDLYSRKILSWRIDESMNKDIVLKPMREAIKARKPPKNLIFHSDQGSQYASKSFQNTLKFFGVKSSMSRRGNCWDNSPSEALFGTIKKELIYPRKIYSTKAEAREEIIAYIEGYYNCKRIHSSIGYKTPIEYEMIFNEKQIAKVA